ncbi:MAG: toxin-antitoxin system YwqK family antitoxin [Saprospiraceae bacterium]
MKLFQISLLILLPISLLSQKANKFEIADSTINVKEIIRGEFGEKMIKQLEQLESIDSPYSYGIFQLDNILEEEETDQNNKFPGGCQCHMMMGKLEISNAVGFMAGIASVIEINLSDSTYQSNIHYNTDGMKTHKFNPEDEFIQDIVVLLKESKLEISPDSKFKNNRIIKGKLIGTTDKYYKQDYNNKGYKEIQTKVLSIFECKLQDYGQLMIEMEKLKELENQKKQDKENKNSFPLLGTNEDKYLLRYPNGQLRTKGKMFNSKKTGQWEFYNPDGSLHKTGKYLNGVRDGLWRMYGMDNVEIAQKHFKKNTLVNVDFLEHKENTYFEYDYVINHLGNIVRVAYLEPLNENEFELFESAMMMNIQYIIDNPLKEDVGLIQGYVRFWTASSPSFGTLKHEITNFVLKCTTPEKDYEYKSTLSSIFKFGKCVYLIENKNKEYSRLHSNFRATEVLIKAYQSIRKSNSTSESKKMEFLLEKYKSQELFDFMRDYDKK